eukprot:TRINITY_DN244_c0_g1_i2.p1 TRINITY_DN244_c0_g1~~TRINITY_DN244_c0_g1_i2.p1  ORF type:complete len:384 (-),score=42.57 TRINITY_DN244_c0_g1_i2:165-1316(-)
MASRPLVTVQSPLSKKSSTLPLPDVFSSPIRTDVVNDVHTRMNKNHRQPYAVSKKAGADTSAQSWGTGRAVSRIPRVSGGGTHRSGQGAFGNMCRGGRMFAPTKVWRRWHVKISKGQRRYATCSALAASSLAPLVLARGHRIENIAEVPLVVADSDFENVSKTKQALALLQALGLNPDLERVSDSRGIRRGKGKARNRRYVQRRGPLLIHTKERSAANNFILAFRNIPGVDVCNVNRLNLLQLAPGGHVGRFIIWTESALKQLDNVFGTRKKDSTQKFGFRPPVGIVTNADVGRIINSEEVQSALRPKRKSVFLARKRNPLKNLGAMIKLNPFCLSQKRRTLAAQTRSAQKRKEKVQANRIFLKQLLEPSVAPKRGEDELPVY